MSFGRIFRIHEGVQFLVRAEFSNIFNRTLMTVSGSTVATGGYVNPSTDPWFHLFNGHSRTLYQRLRHDQHNGHRER